MRPCKLIDRKILLAANGKTAHGKATQIFAYDMYERYAQVRHEFKDLATINANKLPLDVKVTCHIITKDLSTFASVVRLTGDKLLAGKNEFE